jgi:hypothetical protein
MPRQPFAQCRTSADFSVSVLIRTIAWPTTRRKWRLIYGMQGQACCILAEAKTSLRGKWALGRPPRTSQAVSTSGPSTGFPVPVAPGATALVQEIPPTAAGCVRTARRAQRLVKRARQKSPPDPELQAVISAWATPPGAVQAGIKAAMAAAARELEWRRLARHYLDNSGQRPTGTRANGAGGYDPRAHGRQWGLLTGHWDGGCKPPAHE